MLGRQLDWLACIAVNQARTENLLIDSSTKSGFLISLACVVSLLNRNLCVCFRGFRSCYLIITFTRDTIVVHRDGTITTTAGHAALDKLRR